MSSATGTVAGVAPARQREGAKQMRERIVAGVLVGGLLAVKIYWRKLVSLFKKTPPAEENEPGDDDFSSPLK